MHDTDGLKGRRNCLLSVVLVCPLRNPLSFFVCFFGLACMRRSLVGQELFLTGAHPGPQTAERCDIGRWNSKEARSFQLNLIYFDASRSECFVVKA